VFWRNQASSWLILSLVQYWYSWWFLGFRNLEFSFVISGLKITWVFCDLWFWRLLDYWIWIWKICFAILVSRTLGLNRISDNELPIESSSRHIKSQTNSKICETTIKTRSRRTSTKVRSEVRPQLTLWNENFIAGKINVLYLLRVCLFDKNVESCQRVWMNFDSFVSWNFLFVVLAPNSSLLSVVLAFNSSPLCRLEVLNICTS